jgi:monoamine oxidase
VDADVIVIGAGAAGLSAAAELCARETSTLVLEARDRIGGRILTVRDRRVSAPIELGPEFIHGDHPYIFAILQRMGATTVDLSSDEEDDAWEAGIDAALQDAGTLSGDISVASFVERFAGNPRRRDAAEGILAMTEGFDAADPREASIQAFAEEWRSQAGIRGSERRPTSGYGPIARYLADSLDARVARVQLDATVRRIVWSSSGVRIEASLLGSPGSFSAKAAIVTLPLSLLQSGDVAFEPPLPPTNSEALRFLAMGPVYKVGLAFREPVWERSAKAAGESFIRNDRTAFPTIWRSAQDAPNFVTAWAGGPRAARLSGSTRDAIVDAALESAATMLEADLAPMLEVSFLHDWQADPFSRGAYSWVKVDGMTARAQLARPASERLFFAGEATALSGYAGTVAGAFDSGVRVAAEVHEALHRIN